MTDSNRSTETISPDRLRELIEVYNLQCFRGDTALALEELQRLRHYVATCGGTDNDGRCPMHHLAGVSKDTSEDDAFCGDCGEKLEAVRPGKHQHIGPCPSPGARDEDDAPELTADDFKRPSAKWNAPEPSESRTTSLLLSQAARLLREYADDAHAEDVPDVLRWLAVYEGRSTEPAGGHGNPCPLCKAHNLASCECPQEDHVDSVKVQPAFYRIQHKFDKGRFNDFSTDMWDLIIPGLPLTKEERHG